MDIFKLQTDSRKVKKGDTFIALKGQTFDGHDYIDKAIELGASRVIASTKRDYSNNEIIEYVEDSEKYLKQLLIDEYLPKIEQMKLVGITGTNGKTTTCFLTYQMLLKLNKKVSYIGTIGFYCNNQVRELENTTPDILELYKLLIESYQENIEYVVMEVSSHALVQNRVYGLKFQVAGFTNFSQDHLDYHKTMDEYLNAKLLIFNYLNKESRIIINNDDPKSECFKKSNFLTFGLKGDYQILNEEYLLDKTKINFKYNDQEYEVITNLINDFNVYNYLMALIIVTELGYEIDDIIKITSSIYPPKGRVEIVRFKNSLAVVDYAHSPDAVNEIISSFNKIKQGRVMTILGCGGDRDATKRPIMGQIATDLSDYVIFTNDNPRTEDPVKIMNDITKSLIKDNYEIEYNRSLAIKKGLELLKDNDILLILGKGHEDYQITKEGKRHFSDIEEANKHIIELS